VLLVAVRTAVTRWQPGAQRDDHLESTCLQEHETLAFGARDLTSGGLAAACSGSLPLQRTLHPDASACYDPSRLELHDPGDGKQVVTAWHCAGMQWLALVSTVLGALIGVGSTLVVDRRRWSRERSKAMYEARRQLYSDFLADLSTTRDAIRAVARGYHPADISRRQAAGDAFGKANLYSRRYQVSITAPEAVVAAATETFRSLRELRNVAAAGHDNDSGENRAVKARYEAGLTKLIDVMRDDLGPVTSVVVTGRD
jgi:hypothetical protein